MLYNTVNMAVAVGCVRRRRQSHARVADARGGAPPATCGMEAPLLLVQMLAGNAVTAVSVLACLNTADATTLRRLHPALIVAVAAVPWADTKTQVRDTARWRIALPAAMGLKLATNTPLHRDMELAALEGVTVLDLAECNSATDAVIARLPPMLRALNVSECTKVTQHASLIHLPVLESLDCSGTQAVAAGLARLPPSLCTLRMHNCEIPGTADFSHLWQLLRLVACSGVDALSSASAASLPPSLEVLDVSDTDYYNDNGSWPRGWSLAHLTRLRELNASCTIIDSAAIASLPPSLHVLNLEGCDHLSLAAASFAHLAGLHTLNLSYTNIRSAALATLPPSLVSLDLNHDSKLTAATVFPNLPVLRVLNVSNTSIGNAAIASMPVGLEELHMVNCRNVKRRVRLDHLAALRVLQSAGTDLSRATIAAYRARGCFAPADGLIVHKNGQKISMLVSLSDGRLVSSTNEGPVALLEVTAGRGAVVAELELHRSSVRALAVLNDGHRVAVGANNGVVTWDTREAPHDKRVVIGATIALPSAVAALAVAPSGWLVAGCEDGKLRVVDVDAGAAMTTLAAYHKPVSVVAVLLDGRVASASEHGKELSLWEVDTGKCVATLVGHTGSITTLALLPDGRLASGSWDTTVRLWDTVSGICIRVLTGPTDYVYALAVLPDNQLANMAADGMIQVWDTRDDAGSLARPPVIIREHPSDRTPAAMVPLPGNRLATGGNGGVYLWQLPPRAGAGSA